VWLTENVAAFRRAFETAGERSVEEVRWTGDVLAVVVGTSSRVTDWLVEAELAFEDGTVATIAATPNHPFWAPAREAWVELSDLEGGTFTITNPGPLGGTAFAPIVNYPEVAILGMAQARWKPVVRGSVDLSGWSSGDEEASPVQIVPRLILPLILAFDHRVVDGADAARFVSMIVDSLEDPGKMLLGI